MKTAVGYIRVSTVDQATEGVSLAAQEQRIRAWAGSSDYRLLSVFRDEGVSGKIELEKRQVNLAIENACRTSSTLVVFSLTRLGRSTVDIISIAEKLERSGADLVSLSENIDTTSAAGKMIFRMLAVLAEFERDLVSERTKAALSHIRQQGRKTGGHVPFGYDNVDGKLIPNKKESRVVDLILRLRNEGFSLRDICRELKYRRCKTKTLQADWSVNVVAALIRRSF